MPPLLLESRFKTEAGGGICSDVVRVSPLFQQLCCPFNSAGALLNISECFHGLLDCWWSLYLDGRYFQLFPNAFDNYINLSVGLF